MYCKTGWRWVQKRMSKKEREELNSSQNRTGKKEEAKAQRENREWVDE
jgi:hypothetical protein